METTQPIDDERLLALISEGTQEGEGEFWVDERRARVKSRLYRLARPQSFVLSIVQAASLRRADRVEFAIDREDVRVYFGGEPFTHEELERLHHALYARPQDRAGESLRALASGLSAAMALNPEYARLLSGDAQARALLTLGPHGQQRVQRVRPSAEGTWLQVHRRYRPGDAMDFTRAIDGQYAEVAVLRERCTWADIPVFVNGERVSRGIGIEGLWGREPVNEPVARGVVGFRPSEEEAVVDILCSGVWIARHPLAGFPAGFRARIDGSELTTDAVMRDVVRDEAYQRMLAAVAEARDRSLCRLADARLAGRGPAWVESLLREQLLARWAEPARPATAKDPAARDRGEGDDDGEPAGAEHSGSWDRSDEASTSANDANDAVTSSHDDASGDANDTEGDATGDGPEDRAAASNEPEGAPAAAVQDPLVTRLAALPLWRASDGVVHSTRALIASEEEIQYARQEDAETPLPEAVGTVVFVQSREEARFLRRALGERAINVSRAIDRERRYVESYAQWQERRHPPRLGASYYLVRGAIEAEDVRGEVGLRGVGSERSTIRLIKDGCLLQQANLAVPVPGLDAVIEADFTPNRSYNAAHRNDVLARAVFELLCALNGMMAVLARAWIERPHDLSEARALFMPYMFAVLDPDFGVNMLRAFGFAPGSAARHIRILGGDKFVPEWDIDGDEPHPLALVEVFETCAGIGQSLVSIEALRRERGTIAWLGVEHGQHRSIDEPVLWLTDEQHDALVSVFGEDAFTDFSPRLDRLRRREEFMQRPVERLVLGAEHLTQVTFGAGTIRGVLGGCRPETRPEQLMRTHANVRVLKYSRFLGERRVGVQLPGVVAVVNDDQAAANDEWSDLARDDARFAALDDAAISALPALIRAACDQCYEAGPGEGASQRLLLLHVPVAVFEHPVMARAFTALRAADGDDVARADFDEILDLVAEHSQSRVNAALELFLERGETPRAARITGAIRQARRTATTPPTRAALAQIKVRKLLLECVAEVEDVPILRTRGGHHLSFADALSVVREQGALAYVRTEAELARYDEIERALVVLDDAEHHTLARVLGWEALEDIARPQPSRQRTSGHARPVVPRGDRLVAIDVEDGGVFGQLGLRRWGPRPGEPAMIRLRTPRGLAITVFPDVPVPVVGVLEQGNISLDPRTGYLDDATMQRVADIVRRNTGPLLEALDDHWGELDVYELDAGSQWVLHMLAARAPRAGLSKTVADKLRKDDLLAPLLELDAFLCVDGRRRSLLTLAASYSEQGELRYVTEPWDHEAPEFPVVVIDEERREQLGALFPELVEHASEWQREQRIRKRRAQARRLPALPPRHALEAARVDAKGLTGWLWIMPEEGHDAQVRLGHGGLEIERRAVSELFPCEGSITVDGVDHVAREWDAVELSRRQEQALETSALQLFKDLIETYQAVLERGEGQPVSLKGRTRRGLDASVDPSDARLALAGLQVRLHAFRTDGRQRLKSGHRKIYRALAEMPLFSLANQRLISLTTALSERPSELSHLGFWKHESPASGVPMLRSSGREMSTAHLAEELTELPQPSAAQRLLEAVRAELRIVNSNAEDLLTEAYLDLLSIDVLPDARPRERGRERRGARRDADAGGAIIGERDGYVVVNAEHPVVQRAIERFESDALLVSVIASSVYSYFILWADDLEPDMARAFITHHAGHVLSGVSG